MAGTLLDSRVMTIAEVSDSEGAILLVNPYVEDSR